MKVRDRYQRERAKSGVKEANTLAKWRWLAPVREHPEQWERMRRCMREAQRRYRAQVRRDPVRWVRYRVEEAEQKREWRAHHCKESDLGSQVQTLEDLFASLPRTDSPLVVKKKGLFDLEDLFDPGSNQPQYASIEALLARVEADCSLSREDEEEEDDRIVADVLARTFLAEEHQCKWWQRDKEDRVMEAHNVSLCRADLDHQRREAQCARWSLVPEVSPFDVEFDPDDPFADFPNKPGSDSGEEGEEAEEVEDLFFAD